MIRKAFVMQVNPDAHEEYQRRHNPIWPELEAVLKAHGQGISFGLHRFHVVLDDGTPRLDTCDAGLGRPDNWRLHEWAPRPDYRAALAWHPRGRREGLR